MQRLRVCLTFILCLTFVASACKRAQVTSSAVKESAPPMRHASLFDRLVATMPGGVVINSPKESAVDVTRVRGVE